MSYASMLALAAPVTVYFLAEHFVLSDVERAGDGCQQDNGPDCRSLPHVHALPSATQPRPLRWNPAL